MKKAISVTLETENLNWLRSRATVLGCRSISQFLDQLIGEARRAGVGAPESVVGTVRIDDADPDLLEADDALRALFGLTGENRDRA